MNFSNKIKELKIVEEKKLFEAYEILVKLTPPLKKKQTSSEKFYIPLDLKNEAKKILTFSKDKVFSEVDNVSEDALISYFENKIRQRELKKILRQKDPKFSIINNISNNTVLSKLTQILGMKKIPFELINNAANLKDLAYYQSLSQFRIVQRKTLLGPIGTSTSVILELSNNIEKVKEYLEKNYSDQKILNISIKTTQGKLCQIY